MTIKNICILTENVRRLYSFYSKILNMNVKLKSLEYVEFSLGQTSLAIFNVNKHNEIAEIPAVTKTNKSVLIEIEVENVDEEYLRLQKYDIQWSKHLTDQPWGTRSIYFYDVDGNMVSFFTRIKGFV